MHIERLKGYGVNLEPDIFQKSEALIKDFQTNVKFKGLVAYIYYPRKRGRCVGHAELEIEGSSYNWISDDRLQIKKVAWMIENAQSGKGLPFFRFELNVTPGQLAHLRANMEEPCGISCSQIALCPLYKS